MYRQKGKEVPAVFPRDTIQSNRRRDSEDSGDPVVDYFVVAATRFTLEYYIDCM